MQRGEGEERGCEGETICWLGMGRCDGEGGESAEGGGGRGRGEGVKGKSSAG